MKAAYIQQPANLIKGLNKEVAVFEDNYPASNIDHSVVKSFGDEWQKFHQFDENEIKEIGDLYFDILDETIIDKSSYCIDVGCGTGRWSKYLSDKVEFIEAIDPSDAILVADNLLKDVNNIRLSKASVDTIPFADNTFDFGMSVGVLHHIPDTSKALSDCVKKIKPRGHFYVYLYYALDNRSFLYRSLFFFVNFFRKMISSMPSGLKKLSCDLIALLVYMPVILAGRFLKWVGLKKIAVKMPLSGYHKRSFFVIRNDALDRFGTKLEQRFTKKEIINMMQNAGLSEIIVSDKFPYWHALGKKL